MPLFWFSLAIVIGIGTAQNITVPITLLWILVITASVAGFIEINLSRTHRNPFLSKKLFAIPLSFVFLGFLIGLLRFNAELPVNKQHDISSYSGSSETSVSGIVKADPYRAQHFTSIIVDCEQITINGKAARVTGNLSVILPSGYQIEYGERVKLAGKIKNTIENSNLPIHSSDGRRKVFAEMTYPEVIVLERYQGNPILLSLYRFRSRMNVLLFDIIPFPESAVLSGILLGLDTAIPDYLWNGYRASGTAHIIVISGFNVSLIAYLIFKLFKRIWNYQISIPLSIAAIFLFTLFVGADQPVIRAAVMAAIAMPAAYFGRRSIGIFNLMLAAAFMLLINPFQLWDISFQLSFLATLSLLTVVDPVVNWIMEKINRIQSEEKEDRFKFPVELLVSTLSASFVVFPILFKMSGTVSLVSLPANLIIVPLQPFIMVVGSIALLVGSISPVIGAVIARIVWPFVALCNQFALRFSAHPSVTKALPGWVFWASLSGTIALLTYASIHQIIHLAKPNIVDEQI